MKKELAYVGVGAIGGFVFKMTLGLISTKKEMEMIEALEFYGCTNVKVRHDKLMKKSISCTFPEGKGIPEGIDMKQYVKIIVKAYKKANKKFNKEQKSKKA